MKQESLSLSGKGWSAHATVGRSGKRGVFRISVHDFHREGVYVHDVDPLGIVEGMRGKGTEPEPDGTEPAAPDSDLESDEDETSDASRDAFE